MATAKPALQPPAAPPPSAAPAALDLNGLKEQLKETKAIGVFTKLTLRNQVDDLLQQFRDFYQGKAKVTMTQLRRSYDLLLMKVLSLLQDADQKLASAIVASREAIWGLLADPKKFATLEAERRPSHDQPTAVLPQLLLVAAFIAGPSFAADDEALKKDMTAVIALHGLPCGQVVAVKVNADNDYTCSCKDGNRYRVYVNPAGRVVVEKQQ